MGEHGPPSHILMRTVTHRRVKRLQQRYRRQLSPQGESGLVPFGIMILNSPNTHICVGCTNRGEGFSQKQIYDAPGRAPVQDLLKEGPIYQEFRAGVGAPVGHLYDSLISGSGREPGHPSLGGQH